MYVSVDIPVISNNGLTKEIYSFRCEGTRLNYAFYWKYERETTNDVWPDEWEKPSSLRKWLDLNNLDWEPAYEGDEPDTYQKYRDNLNPCMNKTSDGRVMGGGQAGYSLKRDHPIPSNVPALARARLFELLTVDGEQIKCQN